MRRPCCVIDYKAYNKNMFETVKQLEPDPVIEAYKKDVDRTLIRENLRLTFEERLESLMRLQEFADELQKAMRESNGNKIR